MNWLRNLNELAWSNQCDYAEVIFASEVEVSGELEYGEGAILIRPLSAFANNNSMFEYVLRLRVARNLDEVLPKEIATKNGYLFPGGLVSEVLAICSICFEARFFLISVITRSGEFGEFPLLKNDADFQIQNIDRRIDPVVFSKKYRNFVTELGPFLDRIREVATNRQMDLMISIERYARALTNIGKDQELVYVHLVSAVERLSQSYRLDDDSDFERLVSIVRDQKILDEEKTTELSNFVKNRKVKQRFISFIYFHTIDFFEHELAGPSHIQVTYGNIRNVAAAIYNARSGYLHNGDPMYISEWRARVNPDSHADPSVGKQEQSRSFSAEQKLPYADFFHRLVRHCILKRLDELAKE